ncbi:MAG: hypothetical protein M0R22_00015 [Dehalococcoidia bacterium]|jgi:hypothetical protein|nr:hypothetical protein [Dehalococcoidia bacterium]
MQGALREGSRDREQHVATAAHLTVEEAREAAGLLSVEGLLVRAQDYLGRYGKDLRSERGGIPIELAAVLGVLHTGQPGFFWYISPAAQKRLDIGRQASPALQLWAGLRLVNEAALQLEQLAPAVKLPVSKLSGVDWWAAVLRFEALGREAFIELCKRAGGALELYSFVETNDPGPVAGLSSGTVVYRVLAARAWVQAADELAAARGQELELAPGQLIDSRDGRVKAIVKKASLAGYAVAQAAQLVRYKILG